MTVRTRAKKLASVKRAPVRKTAKTALKAKTPSRHWIVVADHRQAHLYHKTAKGVERIPAECLHCAVPMPGGEKNDAVFFQDLADWLYKAMVEKSFDRLALIATPAALKSIEPLLHKKVRACVCAALARDISKICEDEVEDHLTEVVWF